MALRSPAGRPSTNALHLGYHVSASTRTEGSESLALTATDSGRSATISAEASREEVGLASPGSESRTDIACWS